MSRLAEPAVWEVPRAWTANGCFETMRAYGGRIFRLEAHLDRLYASAQSLGTQAPADRRTLGRQLTQALQRSGLKEAVVRVALMPPACAEASAGRRRGMRATRTTASFNPERSRACVSCRLRRRRSAGACVPSNCAEA